MMLMIAGSGSHHLPCPSSLAHLKLQLLREATGVKCVPLSLIPDSPFEAECWHVTLEPGNRCPRSSKRAMWKHRCLEDIARCQLSSISALLATECTWAGEGLPGPQLTVSGRTLGTLVT